MLSRRRWIWIPLFLLVLAISVFNYLTAPVFYRSTTKILVSRGERESSLNPRIRYLRWEEEVGSEMETVLSQPVLEFAESILRDAGIRAQNGGEIDIRPDDITTAPVRGSNVLRVLYQSRDPELAREGVRAVTEAYMGYRRATRTTPEMDFFFRDEIDRVEDALSDLSEKKKTILKDAGIAQISEQRLETLGIVRIVRTSLVNAREELVFARSRMEALRKFRESGSSDVAYIPIFGTGEQRNDTGMRQLVDAMVGLQTEENELAVRYTDDHPRLIEIREQIQGQKALIDEAAARYEEVLSAQADQWRARQAHLEKELADLEAELQGYPEREAELLQVNLELAAQEANYRRLMAEYTSSGIQNASAPNWQVRLYQEPSPPARVHTGDLIRTLVIPIFALIVGLGLALVVDGLDPSIKTVGEAERIFGAPVLASVGRVGRK